MTMNMKHGLLLLCSATVILIAGCSGLKTPSTSSVAVSKAAVDNAAQAGGAEFASLEMHSAREKMAQANKAMALKDYKVARDLANGAQADAKLAQAKANSAKAQAAATALNGDLQVLRQELDRANN